MQQTSQSTTDTSAMIGARDLLMRGDLSTALAQIEPVAGQDDTAAFMLAQVRAFQGDWQAVRSLSLGLLKKPFSFDPYVDGQDLMKLFILSALALDDWKEAKKRVESLRVHLETMLDMSSEFNRFAEAFNRFEAYIWSEGKGKLPFRISSPVNYASMTEDQYARLSSLSLRTTKDHNRILTFDQLDKNKQRSFYLWKALYNEDLDEALQLFENNSGEFYTSLGQAVQLAQLLAARGQEERAWQILKPAVVAKSSEHPFEVAWLDLLWDPKNRELMTPERCLDLLRSNRTEAKQIVEHPYVSIMQRERLNYICSLARCLTEEAVQELEEQLEENSDDLELRLKLIGAYSKYDAANLARKKPHISWLIEKFPDSSIIEDLLFYLFLNKEAIAEDFEEFKQQWLVSIEKNPQNTKILFNASLLLGADDKALAEELLNRAQSLEPDNGKIAERLYELNAFQVKETSGDQRLRHAQAALKQLDILEKVETPSNTSSAPEPFFRLKMLRRRAWFALELNDLDLCRRLTKDMLKAAEEEGFDSTYEFLGKIIYGRLALKTGEIQKAIELLMSTLDMEPFTHFRHDYPHLTLIAELIEAGKTDAVLEFFALDRKQWPDGYSEWLERLFSEIEAGKPPAVPAVML
ncbi:MAG: hypothetical protein JSS83_14445 [Cyanobacteria bacterium SZAS LIN-3]|nr:hypothetical protein [Cyanobacteria bacterium SZAS LIN-3]